MSKRRILLLCLYALRTCKEEKPHGLLELFPESQLLPQKKFFVINEDSLAKVEGLVYDGENLVVYDCHAGDSYTLFDAQSGEFVTPFGNVGQDPTEIPLGCYEYLLRGCFFAFNAQTGAAMKYSIDSLT